MVIATVGRHSTDDVDAVLENIYVYDGDNITTAKMVGRLSDLGLQNTVSSSGMSLSLVNFYNTSSKSYVLGNDASIVKKYNKYSVMLTSKGSEVKGRLVDGSVYGSGYTFYCLDCNEFYLKQLLFDNLGTYNTGFVTLQGQTPTHNMDRLIKYTSQTFTHNQLPQYIPSNVFTMTVSMSFVNITASAVNDDTAWKKAFDGRQGYIFSPRLWDPSNVKNSFDFELRNDSTQLNYQLDLDRMKLDKNMDVLTLQIGSGSGKSPAVNNLYPRDFSSTGIVSSNGNYMKVGFNGTVAAQVRLSFVVTAAKSAANVGILVSLALISYFNLFLC
uniref:CUB-like domain-containing protein n=1 Tax=Caenorhabditis japonica TaxID=281687 RepID=A0A8R1I467_CAEJA